MASALSSALGMGDVAHLVDAASTRLERASVAMSDYYEQHGIPVPEPESNEALKARFSQALRDTYELSEVLQGGERPGGPQHIFDFESGLRLVVSRDNLGVIGNYVHFSMSVLPGELAERLRAVARAQGVSQAMEDMKAVGVERFRYLSDYEGEIPFTGLSAEKSVPHWQIPIETWEAVR